MKHVSESTWERLKGEAAADLYDELHHEPAADASDDARVGADKPADRDDSSDVEPADD